MTPGDLRIQAAELTAFASEALEKSGARPADALTVAKHLVGANLAGHDSHGIGLLPAYVKHAVEGLVDVTADPEILHDKGAVLKVAAHDSWGKVAGDFAMKAAFPKVDALGLCAVTVSNAHHLGRIGAYGELAAQEGFAALFFVNVTDHDPMVAPYRGTDARFGTNPVCIALPPTGAKPAFLLDMATSRIAMGKARVAANKGGRVPFGSIIDADGMPTDDPSGFKGFEQKGALAPFGDHKGYGLAFAAELLAGAFSGGGTIQPGNERRGGIRNQMLAIVMQPDAFGDPADMEREMEAMWSYATASPPADWDSPVIAPGDPERALRKRRSESGIPLDPETVKQLNAAAEAVGVEGRLGVKE
ncbi:malate/lactate/ureidoglycolate dehydrogenase [Hyphobacterium sp.]|uniref:malate/lactate/ureidoglycolate dehydrogenase n=1 Tax=Hyphobacterium sp. TaxID=2004662 RepID=UPI003BAC402C